MHEREKEKMNKIIKNALIGLLLLFIACYVSPPELALTLIILIIGFILFKKIFTIFEKANRKLAYFFYHVMYLSLSSTYFVIGDYIMFFIVMACNVGLMADALWGGPKEIIVKIIDVNKEDSV